MIAVLAMGVALAGLILTSNRGMRPDMRDMRQDMTRMGSRLRDNIKQLGGHVGRVEHSQAKLEGLLEELREATTGRATAS